VYDACISIPFRGRCARSKRRRGGRAATSALGGYVRHRIRQSSANSFQRARLFSVPSEISLSGVSVAECHGGDGATARAGGPKQEARRCEATISAGTGEQTACSPTARHELPGDEFPAQSGSIGSAGALAQGAEQDTVVLAGDVTPVGGGGVGRPDVGGSDLCSPTARHELPGDEFPA
jgi:hypothetical protein